MRRPPDFSAIGCIFQRVGHPCVKINSGLATPISTQFLVLHSGFHPPLMVA
jgi:hypothetical protein